ncbi:NADPH-dependent F420 reductase [Sorangium cellulosum]|uniref:NADPH-dependent F420 reductase n=1 Tax=Sorangium cellulosum TaxID=56 RepID=UPI000CF4044E|nr:NAD(P)-binding domain-containing protein [Sorangium cellulosum]
MKNIGVLGSGRVATVLANKIASAGHTVTIGTRDPARAAAKWSGAHVAFRDHAETARRAAIVVNATPGDTSVERLGALREELRGKIVIDVSNATLRGEDGLPGSLLYPGSSVAERLQGALPETAVVKTLNTMLFTVMADPTSLRVPPTAFLSGNDENAKAVVVGLLGDLGWPADWIEDLGDVATARGPEAVALLVPSVLRRRGLAPFALALAR